MLLLLPALAGGVFVFSGSAAAALQARTFVSPGSGSDANDCSRTQPCLTLQRALNQVVDHGTVTVLDSGLLGTAATISKPVRVTVPAGVEAGLSRATGTLLRVTAPASAVVTKDSDWRLAPQRGERTGFWRYARPAGASAGPAPACLDSFLPAARTGG